MTNDAKPEASPPEPPAKPKRHAQRSRGPSVPVRDAHVWGSPAAGASLFSVYALFADGKKRVVPFPGEGGLEVTELPLEHLSLDLVKQLVGPGAYQLMWRGGESSGKRYVLGWSRPFKILPGETDDDDEEEDDIEAAPAPVPAADDGLGGGFSGALRIMTVLQGMKNAEVQSHLAMFTQMQATAVEMVRAVTQRENQQESRASNAREVDATINNIGLILQKQNETIAALQRELAEMRAERDDDDDDAGSGDAIMRPGDNLGDVAVAAGVNAVVPALRDHGKTLVEGLGSLVGGIGEKLKSDAEARRAATSAKSNGDIRVNADGAVPAASSTATGT